MTTEQLRQSADRVLADPAFRQDAQRLRDALRAAGGAPRAAEEVLARRERPAREPKAAYAR